MKMSREIQPEVSMQFANSRSDSILDEERSPRKKKTIKEDPSFMQAISKYTKERCPEKTERLQNNSLKGRRV
jgi:hypothetical protein